MITIEEIKAAIKRIKDTELIASNPSNNEKNIRFKKGNDAFSLSILDGDNVSKTKLSLLKILNIDEKYNDFAKDAEVAANSINTSPCKVFFMSTEKLKGFFVILNIFSDKLESFENNISEEDKVHKASVLILSMIIETYNCANLISSHLAKLKVDAEVANEQ
ncbi:hypothetical protein BS639_24500 [Rouxiella silvae]|uniref:Uncharacterized protein n=1 Tax=Rouxiella silvae TaxID=1646373 RepID=A0ABX3TTN8_9GAMM|nr:hypothetical protein [Rouxiella silvae]ORJ18588.1 hypothetical protein BS639_24500 [Rouxiella silvae]